MVAARALLFLALATALASAQQAPAVEPVPNPTPSGGGRLLGGSSGGGGGGGGTTFTINIPTPTPTPTPGPQPNVTAISFTGGRRLMSLKDKFLAAARKFKAAPATPEAPGPKSAKTAAGAVAGVTTSLRRRLFMSRPLEEANSALVMSKIESKLKMKKAEGPNTGGAGGGARR